MSCTEVEAAASEVVEWRGRGREVEGWGGHINYKAAIFMVEIAH